MCHILTKEYGRVTYKCFLGDSETGKMIGKDGEVGNKKDASP